MLKLEIAIKKLNLIIRNQNIINLISNGEEYQVGGIANGLRKSHSNMSSTIKKLHMGGIILKRKSGVNSLVRINYDEIVRIKNIVDTFNKMTYAKLLSAPPVEQFQSK